MTTKAIRTEADAIAWLNEAGSFEYLTTEERGGKTYVVIDASCHRCGGGGYGPWQPDGGICYACRGANTRGRVARVSIKRYAQKEKANARARERRAETYKARMEAANERRIEAQRAWCEENGYGPITFEELDAKRAAEREAKKAESEHVGTVGKRSEFTATIEAIPSWDTAYGTTYCHIMRDEDGNRIVWKASTCFYLDSEGGYGRDYYSEKGAKVRFKATVKEHGERDGEKQTIVTRAKLIEVLSKPESVEEAA